jgi:hypothetical protein
LHSPVEGVSSADAGREPARVWRGGTVMAVLAFGTGIGILGLIVIVIVVILILRVMRR